MFFIKKDSNFRRKNFILFYYIYFFCYYCCSINFKRQSEHSGTRPDTSSFVCFWKHLVAVHCCKNLQKRMKILFTIKTFDLSHFKRYTQFKQRVLPYKPISWRCAQNNCYERIRTKKKIGNNCG